MHDETGREMLRLGGYTGSLVDLSLSPDRKTFAVATADVVAMHRATDGRLLWSRRGQAFSVEFHPDGSKVIAGIPTGNLIMRAGDGRVVGGFDTQPAVWFYWTPTALWTKEQSAGPRAWNPNTFAALEDVESIGPVSSFAIHPHDGWMLADGCVRGAALCLEEAVSDAIVADDGSLWVAAEGVVQQWSAVDESGLTNLLPPGGPRVVSIAPAVTGDWLVATEEGAVQRLAADGTARFSVPTPGCQRSPCVPSAIGGYEGQTWVVGPSGHAATWDSTGAVLDKAKKTKAIDAGRMSDGTWVVLQADGRVRASQAPGKGSPSAPLAGARAVEVGGSGYVVVGDEVHPFTADGVPRIQPRLGPNRTPQSVAVDVSGLAYAVLDDAGALHRYGADGRPVFRKPLGLETVEEVVWSADGAWLIIGGSTVRVLDAADGSLHMSYVLSPEGNARALAASAFGFLGLVQGSADSEQVRLVRLPRTETE